MPCWLFCSPDSFLVKPMCQWLWSSLQDCLWQWKTQWMQTGLNYRWPLQMRTLRKTGFVWHHSTLKVYFCAHWVLRGWTMPFNCLVKRDWIFHVTCLIFSLIVTVLVRNVLFPLEIKWIFNWFPWPTFLYFCPTSLVHCFEFKVPSRHRHHYTLGQTEANS